MSDRRRCRSAGGYGRVRCARSVIRNVNRPGLISTIAQSTPSSEVPDINPRHFMAVVAFRTVPTKPAGTLYPFSLRNTQSDDAPHTATLPASACRNARERPQTRARIPAATCMTTGVVTMPDCHSLGSRNPESFADPARHLLSTAPLLAPGAGTEWPTAMAPDTPFVSSKRHGTMIRVCGHRVSRNSTVSSDSRPCRSVLWH